MYEMKVSGLDSLEQKLIALGYEFGSKALRRAGREAMKPMLEEAKRLAPRTSGKRALDYRANRVNHIRDDIKLRAIKGGKDDSPTSMTIRLGTSRKTRHKAAVAEFGRHEFNTIRNHIYGKRINTLVLTIGKTTPHPFMRPAFHNEKENVVRLFRAELKREITKVAKQKAKRERKNNI